MTSSLARSLLVCGDLARQRPALAPVEPDASATATDSALSEV
jgi:hypothetical protein